ncbi:hypothetical protein [Aeribacillus alveayuensis]|uniref:Uncharacterized protein n=1 Tax=Aeribacillus alveayuensis TaxID=279215 RepID=A0ABT9VPW7_9BACI|nr:hypothetical protein [Bacillus alveayuensis]
MNNMRRLTSFLNIGQFRRGMFGQRRNNRGMMWLSLLGIGLGGVWAYMNRNQGTRGIQGVIQPMQKQFMSKWKNTVPNQ